MVLTSEFDSEFDVLFYKILVLSMQWKINADVSGHHVPQNGSMLGTALQIHPYHIGNLGNRITIKNAASIIGLCLPMASMISFAHVRSPQKSFVNVRPIISGNSNVKPKFYFCYLYMDTNIKEKY